MFLRFNSRKKSLILKIEVRTGYVYSQDGLGKPYYPHTKRGEVDLFGIYMPASSKTAYFTSEHKPIEIAEYTQKLAEMTSSA